jgi:hypothetical protein
VTAHAAQPLPECLLCEVPTARAAWVANGGLCTGCAAGVRRAAELLPARPENR